MPRDHAQPTGPTFSLALTRWPARNQAAKIGSLFVNPGGPGGSGIGFLRGAPPGALDLFSRFDVIGWDPRGVGASTPAVDCVTPVEEAAASPNLTFTPIDEVDRGAAVRAAVRDVGRCVARNPGVLPYVGSANNARDLDLLRAAVGDEKLTYLGMSYGAVIGATYASLFPGRARALLLDSPVDPDVWANRPFEQRAEQNASFEASLDRFFAACAAGGDACGFGGAMPEDAYDALVARMNRTPTPAPNAAHPDPVRGDDVLEVSADAMYSVHNWAVLARALREAQAGDASLMRALADGFRGRAPDGSHPATGTFFAVSAQDFRLERDVDAYLAQARFEHAMFPHLWPFSFGQNLRYAVYPLPQNGVFRGPLRNPASAAPVLVTGGTHDPAAPYDQSRRLVRQLGNARLLTYESDGHGASTDLHPCVLGHALAYLNGGAPPAEGTRCVQGATPFPAAAARAAAPPRWEVPRPAR